MDNFDLSSLPADFKAISRPSKVIEALYKKHEQAEIMARQTMYLKRNEICVYYNTEIKTRSRVLQNKLDEIRANVYKIM